MRSPFTRPEVALAGLAGLVLAAGAVSALALAGQDGSSSSSAAPPTRGGTADPTSSASASASASQQASSPAAVPPPPPSPTGEASPPAPSSPDAPQPLPVPEQPPPASVAATFFDAAVQGRDADALAVGEAQALSDLREYEAWESRRLASCAPEQAGVVCVFEAESTFLRLVLTPDPTTGWRVLSIE